MTDSVSVVEFSSYLSLGRINSAPLLAVKVSGICPHIWALLLSGLVSTVNTVDSEEVAAGVLYKLAFNTVFNPGPVSSPTSRDSVPSEPVPP